MIAAPFALTHPGKAASLTLGRIGILVRGRTPPLHVRAFDRARELSNAVALRREVA